MNLIIGLLIIFATVMFSIAIQTFLPPILGWPLIALMWAGALWIVYGKLDK